MTEPVHTIIDNISYREHSELIFIGTGCSGGIPCVTCLISPNPTCIPCTDAVKPNSKNTRRNTCIVIKTTFTPSEITENHQRPIIRNIMVDCGKYFWPAALKVFPACGIDHLDAIILTHAHADAYFGIDDLRDFSNVEERGCTLPVYIREKDIPEVSKAFPYLMTHGKTSNNMHVPALSFETYPEHEPFNICGATFTPLQVHHGANTTCTALAFGNNIYMADVNEIPSEVHQWILANTPAGKLDLMVLDALWPEKPYAAHFSLKQAVDHFKLYKPKLGLTVGMDHSMEHDTYNTKLQALKDTDQLDIQLAFDGQVVPIQMPISGVNSFPKLPPRLKLIR